MALPSSPPLLPEFDLPTSPPLLPDEPDLPFRPSELVEAHDRPNLKRQFSDYDSLSSDPIFSEGTSEAEDDGSQGQPRRKRLVRGPWYDLRRVSGQSLRQSMAKRERLRFADSGVWLGSEMSDDTVDNLLSSQRAMADLEMLDDEASSSLPSTQASHPPPTAENLAAEAISHAVDAGRETFDISELGLTTLSNATLKPMHQLIRHAHIDLTQPPSEDEFTSLTPSIKLYLYGNRLTSLPAELFSLTNIAVLSLRNNDLDEIPPSIGRLSNLMELNLSQNNIRHLPWEMLNLMHCQGEHRNISVRPNPLIDPVEDFSGPSPLRSRPNATQADFREHLSRWGETSGAFFEKMVQWYSEEGETWSMRHELELRLKLSRIRLMNYLEGASRAGMELSLCKEQLVYLASSAVKYFDVGGSLCRPANTVSAGTEGDDYTAVVDPLVNAPLPSTCSNAPSLFELSLRSAQASFNLSDLDDLPQEVPRTVTAALRQAARGAEYGNEVCSVCGKHFVIARAEWVEYWFNGFPAQQHLMHETTLPFLRKACSWSCARPSEMGAFRF